MSFAVTNWVGPGFVPKEDDDGDTYPTPYSYRYMKRDAYSSEGDEILSRLESVINHNYLGPRLNATRGGTLYFVEAKAMWIPLAGF